MRRASTARASRACVPTYTASPSPAGTTHHHGADPSAGASFSRGAIAPLDGSSVHVATVPSMDVDTTRSGRPVAASGGIVASARTAPACASRSSVTRVGVGVVGVSSDEAWTRLPRSGTPVADDDDVGRRARRARGRVRAPREGTRRVADVVAREDAAMRDIPPPTPSPPRTARPRLVPGRGRRRLVLPSLRSRRRLFSTRPDTQNLTRGAGAAGRIVSASLGGR